ncbi:MAG: endonuclease III [SAR86 cluster bacterium]|jgi:endonuclease-3|uniref:HhH-GPD domain-containing protein n=1 Tax=marine metagenome TaxID=408172 RepID=A0A382DDV6_9ZZZZ|tara:strand:- start:407 stop:1066 length:660 start_codon:yes stop_codon:yes gene_type:complete
MNKAERVLLISESLNALYPDPPIPLDHESIFTLLIAVILSAQCTDIRVNKITPLLFKKANNPQRMIKLGIKEIKKIIKPCGLSPQKSKSIFELSKILIKKHGGKVPKSFVELEALPGVGHKTASVVMSQGFGYPAFPVDTHVHRLAQRWKLTNGKNVQQTEKDLKRIFPESEWNKLHIQIILYGREFCTARGCFGTSCREKPCSILNSNRKRPIKTKKP